MNNASRTKHINCFVCLFKMVRKWNQVKKCVVFLIKNQITMVWLCSRFSDIIEYLLHNHAIVIWFLRKQLFNPMESLTNYRIIVWFNLNTCKRNASSPVLIWSLAVLCVGATEGRETRAEMRELMLPLERDSSWKSFEKPWKHIRGRVFLERLDFFRSRASASVVFCRLFCRKLSPHCSSMTHGSFCIVTCADHVRNLGLNTHTHTNIHLNTYCK